MRRRIFARDTKIRELESMLAGEMLRNKGQQTEIRRLRGLCDINGVGRE